MEQQVLDYDEFISRYYDECKAAEWFQDVLNDSYDLDTDSETVSSLIGCIHEGLREDYDEAIKFFWTVFLINPLIAIKAYQESDILLKNVDVYITFKHINPLDYNYKPREDAKVIFNQSVEYFLVFAMEALLQKDMNPEMLDVVNRTYLGGLYNHDKEIMSKKREYLSQGIDIPAKWITHRNLGHILNGIDPHHIIILLEFFADRYGARLRKGNVGKFCYSKDKYDYIIRFIKNKYGSLSEYIEWDNINFFYHYERYYRKAMQYPEMKKDIDVIFPTVEDKRRISRSLY